MRTALFICICLAFAACSRIGKPTKDNLVIAIEKAPMSLDPRYATDTFSERICRLLYSGLLDLDDNFKFFPDLAESYSLQGDKTYVFKLRKGVRFHDGSPLTSTDVKFTYESVMDPKNGSHYANSFEDVEKIETPDDHTVIVTMKRPSAAFMTAVRIGIIPRASGQRLGKQFMKEAVGSGPFRLDKNLGRDGVILLRNESYYGGSPKLERVTYKPILDDTVRALELMKGSVDLVLNAIPAELLTEVRKNENIKVEVGDGVQYQYMGFNFDDPILQNEKVRKAVAYAIDRDSIIKFKLGNYAKKSTGLLAPINWAYSPDVRRYEYDPAKSRRLLDEAGYPIKKTARGEHRFDLTYKTSTNPESLEIAGVIAENLRKVGINVELRSLEFGVFYDDIRKGNFQIYTLSWTGITDPIHYHYIFNSLAIPPNGGNRGRFRNKKMDDLTELAKVTLDWERQKNIYSQIQKIASEELPYVSLWHKDNIVAMRKGVMGFKLKANGEYYYLKETYKE